MLVVISCLALFRLKSTLSGTFWHLARMFYPLKIKASCETYLTSIATVNTLKVALRGNRVTEQKATEIATINQQIEAINKRIVTLKESIIKTREETKKHIADRDQLNDKVKGLRLEIAEIKKERDQLNVSVRSLKQQRDEVRGQMAPFIEEIKGHSQRIRELKEKYAGESRQELQKAFDALEFKIATTSMDLHEEKRLIDQVKEIETRLSVFKKIDQHNKKIGEIRAELKVFEDKADVFHGELTQNAKKSQELHARMLAKFEEMKKLREDATNLHLQFLLDRERVKPMQEEIGRLIDQRRRLFGARQGQYLEQAKQYEERRKAYEERKKAYEDRKRQFDSEREESEKLKKAKEQEIKEKIGSEAREKLQRGEKVDWNEFQLLAGEDSETED